MRSLPFQPHSILSTDISQNVCIICTNICPTFFVTLGSYPRDESDDVIDLYSEEEGIDQEGIISEIHRDVNGVDAALHHPTISWNVTV